MHRIVISIAIGMCLGAVIGFCAPILYSSVVKGENNPQIGLISIFLGVPLGIIIGALFGWLFRPGPPKNP